MFSKIRVLFEKGGALGFKLGKRGPSISLGQTQLGRRIISANNSLSGFYPEASGGDGYHPRGPRQDPLFHAMGTQNYD